MTTPLPSRWARALGAAGHDPRRLRRLLVPLVVAGLLAGGSALAVVPSTGSSDPAAEGTGSAVSTAWALAKVHVTITTTSDWSTVQLAGAYLLVRRGAPSTGLRSSEVGDGWSFNGSGTYEGDVVLGARPTDLQVTVDKGRLGAAQVVMTAAKTGVTLLTVRSDTHNTSGEHPNRVTGSLSRGDLTAAVVPPADLPRGDTRRLTLAFAYPWFDASYSDRNLAEKPSDPRSWFGSADVLSMTQQAKANGIDGFVMSYAGEADNGASLDRLLAAAHQTGSVVAPYLETAIAVQKAGPLPGNKQALVEQWLRSALQRANDSAFLTLRGVPVVFVYQMQKLTTAQWDNIKSSLRSSGKQVVLVGDAYDASYLPLMGGSHSYTATDDIPTLASRSQYASVLLRARSVLTPTVVPEVSVATVSPGYDDRKLRGFANPVIPRDGGRRYDDTWAAALSGTPDWVVVTSWNEWYEGTSVEPGTVSGDQALAQTKQHAAAFRAQG